MMEKFEGSKYAKNSVNRVAFMLGLVCSIIRENNREIYVDRIIKSGFADINRFDDLIKLNVEAERILMDDEKSRPYREMLSDQFLKVKKEEFDPDEAMMMFGVGLSAGNYLGKVLTFSEATEKWGLSNSTLRKSQEEGRFLPGETRKSGGTWLVTESAMYRLYGEPKEEN